MIDVEIIWILSIFDMSYGVLNWFFVQTRVMHKTNEHDLGSNLSAIHSPVHHIHKSIIGYDVKVAHMRRE